MIGVGNGVLRVATYGRVLPELRAHQLSTLIGILLSGFAVFVFDRFRPLPSAGVAWTVGGIWVALTVSFEFAFGHYVAGHPWQRLLADYDLLAGRVWPLFLVWLGCVPYLVYRLGAARR